MMKLIFYVMLLPCILFLGGSCKKEMIVPTPLASLKIVNFVSGGESVRMGSRINPVNTGISTNFSLLTGNQDIYVWPVSDSLHPYYSSDKAIFVEESDVYTLFLGGTSTALETFLVKESLPIQGDSTAGIRFVHLASGGPKVDVTLATSPDVNEFTGIDYRGITEFKTFPANSAYSYTFEVRNADTREIIAFISMRGTSLATIVPRFRNVTLVFWGTVGGIPGLSLSRVNHYYDR